MPLLLLGCSAAVITPNLTLEDGWILYRKPSEGFVIALPPTWKEIPIDQTNLVAAYKVIMEKNPSMAAYMKDPMNRQMLAFIKFAALDSTPNAINGFPNGVEIYRIPGKMDQTLDNLVQESLIVLRVMAFVVKPISHRSVSSAVGPAYELQFGLNMTMPNGEPLSIAITQYFIVTGDHLNVIKFLTRSNDAQKYAPIFAKSVESFRLTGN